MRRKALLWAKKISKKKKSDSVKVKHNVFNSDPEKFPLTKTFNK